MSEDADVKYVSTTLIYQCRVCRRIIGDSVSLRHQDTQNNTITLGTAHAVEVVEDYKTSHSGFDVGCTYLPIKCECGIEIGRMYKTTPRSLDYLRDMFTISTDVFDTYGVGMPRHGAPVSDWFNKSLDTVLLGQSKLMTVVLAMEERLSALEAAFQASAQGVVAHEIDPQSGSEGDIGGVTMTKQLTATSANIAPALESIDTTMGATCHEELGSLEADPAKMNTTTIDASMPKSAPARASR